MTPLDWLVLTLLSFGGAVVLGGWCWLIAKVAAVLVAELEERP